MRFFLPPLLCQPNLVLAQCSDTPLATYDPNNTDSGTTRACVTMETHAFTKLGHLAGMTTYRVYVQPSRT